MAMSLGLATRPRSHKCVAVSPSHTRLPPERRAGFRYGKNSPLLAHFVRNSPPLFAFARVRSVFLTDYFALLIILKTSPVLTATHHPCPTRVAHSLRSFGVHFVHPAPLGREGVRRAALICLMVNIGQVFGTNFLKRKFNKEQ